MKQSILAMVAVISMIAANPAVAAGSDVRLDRLEQQISRFAAELEHMRSDFQAMDERLDTVDDIELTLVRMERKLRNMRRQLRESHIESVHARPMLVPATW